MIRYAQYGVIALAALVFLSQFIWRSGGAGITNSIVVFVIAWWLIFLMTLPIGVRNHHETGESLSEGSEAAAPTDPQLKRKAWWSTVGTSAFWLLWVAGAESGLVSLPETLP